MKVGMEERMKSKRGRGAPEDPVGVLIEQSDPEVRALAHLALGERALSRGQRALAIRHYREAASLDPSREEARAALHRLGEPVVAFRRTRSPVLRRLFSSVLQAGRRSRS